MKRQTKQKVRLYTSQFFAVMGALVFITGLMLTLFPLFISRLIADGTVKVSFKYCADFFEEFTKKI